MIFITSLIYNLCHIPFAPSNTSACWCSSSLTYTFMLEYYDNLLDPFLLDFCNLSLRFTTIHGSSKKHPEKPLGVLETLPLITTICFHLVIRINKPSLYSNLILCLLFQWHEQLKITSEPSQLLFY